MKGVDDGCEPSVEQNVLLFINIYSISKIVKSKMIHRTVSLKHVCAYYNQYSFFAYLNIKIHDLREKRAKSAANTRLLFNRHGRQYIHMKISTWYSLV